MGGVQMLNKDIGHAGCRREMFQEPGERFEATRRSSNAHHGTEHLRERLLTVR
jgi:hypothetical protein